MQYLCPKHQQHILQDPELAKSLWAGAMESGVVAFQQRRWQTARNFFGSAYETTLLYMWNKPVTEETIFSIEHLVDAGQSLSESLKQLKIWDEAQVCLLTLQNSLLHLNNHKQADSNTGDTSHHAFLNREETLNLTHQFVKTLTASLSLQTRLKHCDSLQTELNSKNTVHDNNRINAVLADASQSGLH